MRLLVYFGRLAGMFGLTWDRVTEVLKLVRSGLSWLTLALLIMAMVLGTLIKDPGSPAFMLSLGIFLVLIVLVFILLIRRVPIGDEKTKWSPVVTLSISFPINPPPTGFKNKGCEIDVLTEEGEIRTTLPIIPFRGPGGWSVKLTPKMIEPADGVVLRLCDGQDRKWATAPFIPFHRSETVDLLGDT